MKRQLPFTLLCFVSLNMFAASTAWLDQPSIKTKYLQVFENHLAIKRRLVSKHVWEVKLAENELQLNNDIKAKAPGAVPYWEIRRLELELANQRTRLTAAEFEMKEAESFQKVVEQSLVSGLETPVVVQLGGARE